MAGSSRYDPYARPLRPWNQGLKHDPSADDPYSMGPIEPEVVDESGPSRKPFVPLVEPPDPVVSFPDALESQFSLRDLMILITLASVLFAGMARLPKPVFAGAAGLMALLMLGIFSLFPPRHPLLVYGWWLLFATYLMASLLAAINF